MRMCRWMLIPAVLVLIVHGSSVADEKKDTAIPEGFKSVFNGKNLEGWKVHGGNMEVWGAETGVIYCGKGGGGWLLTEAEYGDFELRFEFKLPKGGNSGVGLRTPRNGDPAYQGMEIQLIDDANWKGLQPWQHTGSIYDVVPAEKQVNKPFGEWNSMRIVCKGSKVLIEENGEKLVDTDLTKYKEEKGKKHPGILRDKGHVGFQSYNLRVEFRNIWIKEMK